MFGFRPGRRTADPLLVLRHMIDTNRAGVGTKFGVAFMDLSAAYYYYYYYMVYSTAREPCRWPLTNLVASKTYSSTAIAGLLTVIDSSHHLYLAKRGISQWC
jgi:hypothetical protein